MKKKKIMAIALATGLIISSVPKMAFAETKTFVDVKDHANQKAIEALAAENIVIGIPDGTFAPKKAVTRAEASIMIVRAMLGVDKDAKLAPLKGSASKFTDLAGYDWAKPYLVYLTDKGILSGYTDGTMKPANPVTKAELAALVMRAAGEKLDIKGKDWNAEVLKIAKEKNLLKGTKDVMEADRANSAQIIFNGLEKLKEAGKVAVEPEPQKPEQNTQTIFGAENPSFIKDKFNDEMTTFAGKKIATDVKIFTFGLAKDYNQAMTLPKLSEATKDTVFKYKSAKAPAFYVEKNGEIVTMLLPKNAGFSGRIYGVINGVERRVGADGTGVDVIKTIVAGHEVDWYSESGFNAPSASDYQNGEIIELIASDGIISKAQKATGSTGSDYFVERTQATGDKWVKVEKTDRGVITLEGNILVPSKENPTVYTYNEKDGKYALSSYGAISKDKKIRIYDITDDKEDGADLIVVLEK